MYLRITKNSQVLIVILLTIALLPLASLLTTTKFNDIDLKPINTPSIRNIMSEGAALAEAVTALPIFSLQGTMLSDNNGSASALALLGLNGATAHWHLRGEEVYPGIVLQDIQKDQIILRQGMAYYEIALNRDNFDTNDTDSIPQANNRVTTNLSEYDTQIDPDYGQSSLSVLWQ